MNRLNNPLTLVIAALALLLLSSMFFTVNESQKAIKLRLGEITDSEFDPGLHFKLPMVHRVIKFDKRLLTLDVKPERVLTSCLLYTSPSPRDATLSRMPSSA